jgi:predicted amidohydrolase
MQPFTVAATQVETRHLDVDHNLELHVRLIEETAARAATSSSSPRAR